MGKWSRKSQQAAPAVLPAADPTALPLLHGGCGCVLHRGAGIHGDAVLLALPARALPAAPRPAVRAAPGTKRRGRQAPLPRPWLLTRAAGLGIEGAWVGFEEGGDGIGEGGGAAKDEALMRAWRDLPLWSPYQRSSQPLNNPHHCPLFSLTCTPAYAVSAHEALRHCA